MIKIIITLAWLGGIWTLMISGCQREPDPVAENNNSPPVWPSEIQARFQALLERYPPSITAALGAESGVRMTPSDVQWPFKNPIDPSVEIGWWPTSTSNTPPVRIAIIDESFDVAAPGLKHAFDVDAGVNLLNPGEPLWMSHREGFHHGNLVASIIANRPQDPVAPLGILAACEVELIPIVAAGGHGPAWRAPRADPAMVLAGLRYAFDQHAEIINISAGTPVTPRELKELAADPIWDQLEASGIPVVCAAGNEGVDLDQQPYFPASIKRPNVITVMGIGPTGCLAQTPSASPASNWGVNTVDLAAPGEQIEVQARSMRPQLVDGTSAAAAFVTAGLVLAPALPVRPWPDLQQRCRRGGFLRLPPPPTEP